MKEKYPARLFGRSNKTGLRLLSIPISICWAVVEDANGIRLRVLHNDFYDGKRGGAPGLGRTIYNQVLKAGEKCKAKQLYDEVTRKAAKPLMGTTFPKSRSGAPTLLQILAAATKPAQSRMASQPSHKPGTAGVNTKSKALKQALV